MSNINYISISAVAKLTGMKKKEVLRLVSLGEFPRPNKDKLWIKKRVTDWLVDQVQQQGYSI